MFPQLEAGKQAPSRAAPACANSIPRNGPPSPPTPPSAQPVTPSKSPPAAHPVTPSTAPPLPSTAAPPAPVIQPVAPPVQPTVTAAIPYALPTQPRAPTVQPRAPAFQSVQAPTVLAAAAQQAPIDQTAAIIVQAMRAFKIIEDSHQHLRELHLQVS